MSEDTSKERRAIDRLVVMMGQSREQEAFPKEQVKGEERQTVDMLGTLTLLRREIRRETTVPAEGTVLRFKYLGRYTYVALFVAGSWWLSGGGRAVAFGALRHRDFVQQVLVDQNVSDIEIAEGWRAL